MAENQPPSIVEGATSGDVDDEIPLAAKSADDRKAFAALNNLDTREDDSSNTKDVDQEAVRKAMDRLTANNGTGTKNAEDQKPAKKVKVAAVDVEYLVQELEIAKAKATELIKSFDGDIDQIVKDFIRPQ